MGLTGLLPQFEGRIFSANDVDRGKPFPDHLLLAAHQCDVASNRRAVVKDRVAGVTARLASGVKVFAFWGGVTSTSALELELDDKVVFRNMAQLADLLTHA